MSNLRALDPDQELRPAWLTSELFPFTSRFVEVDGARVHYVDEGHGPVTLFLHEHTNFLMKYTAGTFPMSAEERSAFLAPYVGAVARRNPGTLLGDLAGDDAYMSNIEQALRTQLNHLPVLLMWGDKDPVFEF